MKKVLQAIVMTLFPVTLEKIENDDVIPECGMVASMVIKNIKDMIDKTVVPILKKEYNLWENIESRNDKEYDDFVDLILKNPTEELKIEQKVRVLGVGGIKFAGKNTFADFMKDWTQIAFADAVKTISHLLFNLDNEYWYGKWKEVPIHELGTQARTIMQIVGKECFRDELYKLTGNYDVWVNIVSRKISRDQTKKWIITDCRFENEIKYVHKMNGFVVKIINSRVKTNQFSNHDSEKIDDLKGFDFCIKNEGKLEELKKEAKLFDAFLDRFTIC